MTTGMEKSGSRRKPNYVYSIVSVALVLFLIGLFGLIMLHAQRLVKAFRETITIMVELTEEATATDIAALEKHLKTHHFVKKETVQFVSKEEAAQQMQQAFGEDFSRLDLPNPYYNAFFFNVKAAYMQADSLQKLEIVLKQAYPKVSGVFYQQSFVDNITGNIQRLGFFALGVGIFLVLIAAVLIYNTVRLALYANRFIIKNMELVGASWEFISKPYLIRGIMHGLLSGLLATTGLILLLLWAHRQIPDLKVLQNIAGFITLFSGLLISGVLINTIGAYFVIRKYLKMRVDDLY